MLQLTNVFTSGDLEYFLHKGRLDCACVATSYTPVEMLNLISLLAKAAEKQSFLFPLIYLIDWRTPLPTLLGTHWAGKVGVVHSLSSAGEISALFARLHVQSQSGEAADHRPRQ